MRSVRFADTANGWLFGPDLWATHNGGATWERPAMAGRTTTPFVMALETSAGAVHAVLLDNPTHVETTPVARDAWRQSSPPLAIGGGPVPYAQLVLQGGTGWLAIVNRTVVSGARLINGGWSAWQPPCLSALGPMYLAASTTTDLVAVCDEGVWGPASLLGVRALFSHDGGLTFQLRPTPLPQFGPVASPAANVAVTTGDGGLVGTFDGGVTWTLVHHDEAGAGSAVYIGFTSGEQGVAVEANNQPQAPAGQLLMTFDGGHSWSRVSFQ